MADEKQRELIANVLLSHETSYIKSSHEPIALYLWKCSCGDEEGRELTWDDCHKKTREHWAEKAEAALAESGAGQVLQPVCSVAPWHPIKYVDPSATSNLVGLAEAKEKEMPMEEADLMLTTDDYEEQSYTIVVRPWSASGGSSVHDEAITFKAKSPYDALMQLYEADEYDWVHWRVVDWKVDVLLRASQAGSDNEISITIRGQEQVAIVMKALHDAGFVAAALRLLKVAEQAGSSSRIEIKPTDLCAKVHCGHPASEHDDDGNCTHHKCFCGRFEIGRQAGPSYDPWAAKEKDEPIPCPTCGSIECCGLTCGTSSERA